MREKLVMKTLLLVVFLIFITCLIPAAAKQDAITETIETLTKTPTGEDALVVPTSDAIFETVEPQTETPDLNATSIDIETTVTLQPSEIITKQTQLSEDKNAKEINIVKKSLERALEIENEASASLDPEKLADASTNDKRFRLSQSGLQTVRELTDNPTLESAGYYDYVHASITWLRDAILKREALTEKARSENRNLTEEERKSLVSNGGRIAPSRIGPREGSIDIKFISIEINDDIAKVITVIGATTAEYTLVNYGGKWYVAYYRGIMVNP